jgi:two-component system phosphate regulon response regulator PhoB
MNGTAGLAGEGRATVLVVEDDDDLRAALTYGLQSEGFAVEAVPTASAAYACVDVLAPDVVLLDWWLSEGEQGAAACRRLAEECGVPVVMHTGMSDARDRAAAYRAGAVAFIEKGTPLEELADRLRQVVGQARVRSPPGAA